MITETINLGSKRDRSQCLHNFLAKIEHMSRAINLKKMKMYNIEQEDESQVNAL